MQSISWTGLLTEAGDFSNVGGHHVYVDKEKAADGDLSGVEKQINAHKRMRGALEDEDFRSEELKLEKKNGNGKKKDEEDDGDMEEMLRAAARFGFTVEATTATDKQRYGGGKGRGGKGTEDGEGSDAENQEDCNGPEEQELIAWAAKHNLKLEKKNGKKNGKNGKKDGEDGDMEERVSTLQAQLRDAKTVLEQKTTRTKSLEEQARLTDVKSYIFEKCASEKKFKNALVERLLAGNPKTKEEVDAKLPVEKAATEKLLMETAGGRGTGLTSKDEPVGSDDPEKLFKTKDGKTLTEAQLRQRDLAGLKTELVEQA